MNIVRRRRYIIEFDVWDPLRSKVDKEMDEVVRFVKDNMSHSGNIHIFRSAEDNIELDKSR